MRPKLSIVIVTYLSKNEIVNCIESIPKVIHEQEVEVIVVENNSGDDIEEVISDFEHIKFINHGINYGFGKANNIGFEASSGDNILFLNPDTIVNENALIHCMKRLESENEIGFISPKLVMLYGGMDLACRRSIPTIWDGFSRAIGLSKLFPKTGFFCGYNLTHLPDNGTYEVGAINGAFMMCTRKNILRIGLFDEQYFMYGDDLDLCYRSTINRFKKIN